MFAKFYSREDNLNSKNCATSVLSYNSFSRPFQKEDNVELFVRAVPYEEKRTMVIDYAEANGVVDALEIADSLQLDVFEVNDIMKQLINEGILKELD